MTWLHRKQERYVEFLDPLQLPLRFANPKLELLPVPKLREKAVAYVKDFLDVGATGIAPLFVGNAGTGKTFAAALVAKAIYHRYRVNVEWVNASGDFTKIDRAYYAPEGHAALERMKQAPLLILDDLAQLAPGSRQMTFALEVITHRFDNLSPTLVTANLAVKGKDPADVFDAHFGVCMGRRLLEASEGFRVLTE